jgi:solute carrier family 5 (sodium-coupled monocarboxylate transporter), member 8/12
MDVDNEKLQFSTIDYAFFCTMLALSCLIGVYYGFFAKRKQNTTEEYLLGSKSMKVFPVAMSLTATLVLNEFNVETCIVFIFR